MTRRVLPILIALVLLAGACGGDDASTDDAAGDEATETETDTESEDETGDDGDGATTGDASVTIQNFAFEPAAIDVDAGTTVTWTNEDGVTHTVTSGSPGDADGTFDETVDSGSTVEIGLDEAGTYAYFCAIHPNMTGEVVVS